MMVCCENQLVRSNLSDRVTRPMLLLACWRCLAHPGLLHGVLLASLAAMLPEILCIM